METCTVGCAAGYEGRAETFLCERDTFFSGENPKCAKVQCRDGVPAEDLADYLDTSRCNDTMEIGEDCMVMCGPGYAPQASLYRCGTDGQLLGEPPTCERLECEVSTLPTEQPGINVTSCFGLLAGDICWTTCAPGYVGDPANLTCGLSGAFSGTGAQCVLQTCDFTFNASYIDGGSCEGVQHGSSCVAQCGYGYTGVPQIFECLFGDLVGTEPTCDPVPCDKNVPYGEGIDMSHCEGMVMGDECVLECAPGYEIAVDTLRTITCGISAQGTWSSATFECQRAPCTDLASAVPAYVADSVDLHGCTGLSYGDGCTAACKPGYQMDFHMLICGAMGGYTRYDWNHGNYSAEASGLTCVGLPGNYQPQSYKRGVDASDCATKVTGETCIVTALEGYDFYPGWSNQTHTVLPDGHIDGWQPWVIPQTCEMPTLEDGRTEILCDIVTPGGSCQTYCDMPTYLGSNDAAGLVTYVCNDEYQMQPQSVDVCTSNRRVLSEHSSSEPFTSSSGRRLTGGACDENATVTGLNTPGIDHHCAGATTCPVFCGVGYNGSLSFYTCNAGTGLFEPVAPYTGLPVCVPDACAYGFPTGTGVSHNCDNATTDSTCIASCAQGYSLAANSTPATFTCGTTGELSGTNPTCVPNTCSTPNTTSGSNFDQCVGLTTGQECSVACAQGYTIVGAATTYMCSATSGVIEGTPPICVPEACTTGVPTGAEMNVTSCQGLLTDQTCRVSCMPGYLGDPTVMTCDGSGTVTGSAPVCEADTCAVSQIPMPIGRKHTCQKLRFIDFEDVCTMFCRTGYELDDGANIQDWTCEHDRSIDGNITQCVPKECLDNLPLGDELQHTCNGVRTAETCSAACALGYTGNATSMTCQPNGAVSGNTPDCIARECPAFAPGPIYEHTCDGIVFGSNCLVYCAEGYIGSSSSWSCEVNGTGAMSLEGTYPVCEASPCHTSLPTGLRFDVSNCSGAVTGSLCTVQCGPLYEGTGPETWTCLPNGTMSGSYPVCEVITTTTSVTTISRTSVSATETTDTHTTDTTSASSVTHTTVTTSGTTTTTVTTSTSMTSTYSTSASSFTSTATSLSVTSLSDTSLSDTSSTSITSSPHSTTLTSTTSISATATVSSTSPFTTTPHTTTATTSSRTASSFTASSSTSLSSASLSSTPTSSSRTASSSTSLSSTSLSSTSSSSASLSSTSLSSTASSSTSTLTSTKSTTTLTVSRTFTATTLSATTTSSFTASSFTTNPCACVYQNGTLPGAFWEDGPYAGEANIRVYGTFCAAWDNMHGTPWKGFCPDDADFCVSQFNWCTAPWCYVDGGLCTGTHDVSQTSVFSPAQLYYSYGACGAPNCYGSSNYNANECPYDPMNNCTVAVTLEVASTVSGVDYSSLTANASLQAAFEASCQSAVAEQISAASGSTVNPDQVTITISAGSVQISATVALDNDVDTTAVTSSLESGNSSFASSMAASITAVPGIADVVTGEIGVTAPVTAVTVSASSVPNATIYTSSMYTAADGMWSSSRGFQVVCTNGYCSFDGTGSFPMSEYRGVVTVASMTMVSISEYQIEWTYGSLTVYWTRVTSTATTTVTVTTTTETNWFVQGSFTILVSLNTATSFIEDPQVNAAMAETVAAQGSVPASLVTVELSLITRRRLREYQLERTQHSGGNGRLLSSSGAVLVNYHILIPRDSAYIPADVYAAMEATNMTTLADMINTNIDAQIGSGVYLVTVTSFSVPALVQELVSTSALPGPLSDGQDMAASQATIIVVIIVLAAIFSMLVLAAMASTLAKSCRQKVGQTDDATGKEDPDDGIRAESDGERELLAESIRPHMVTVSMPNNPPGVRTDSGEDMIAQEVEVFWDSGYVRFDNAPEPEIEQDDGRRISREVAEEIMRTVADPEIEQDSDLPGDPDEVKEDDEILREVPTEDDASPEDDQPSQEEGLNIAEVDEEDDDESSLNNSPIMSFSEDINEALELLSGPVDLVRRGREVEVTDSAERLEEECRASGLSWPDTPGGEPRTALLGHRGLVSDIDFGNDTVSIAGHVVPVRALVDFEDWEHQEVQEYRL